MNVIEQAQRAYGAANVPLRTERATESRLLSQITARLRRAAGEAGSFPALAEAIQDNRRIWVHFAAMVADDDNALPAELRARLFYLAEFTIEYSRKVLRGAATADALIEINMAVIRGLDGTGA